MRTRLRVGDLILDKSSVVPLYLQLKQHLIYLISYGIWQTKTTVVFPHVALRVDAFGNLILRRQVT